MTDTTGGSPDRFGYEWARYSAVSPQYENQFRRWLPFFSNVDWTGKRFLDVGCGMGRNSLWPMKYGATSGVAVAIDDRTLAAAQGNVGSLFQCASSEVQRLCAALD